MCKWYGARDTEHPAATDDDRAKAHKSYGPWPDREAANAGIRQAVLAEMHDWLGSPYDADYALALRCLLIAHQFAVDRHADAVHRGHIVYRIWQEE